MSPSNRRSGRVVATWSSLAFGAGLAMLAACAQLVGIGDTDVTRGEDGGPSLESGPGLGMGDTGGGSDDVMTGSDASGADGSFVSEGGPTDDTGPAPADATTDGVIPSTDAGCSAGATRCGASGREMCTANQWTSSPCPISTPSCVANQCTLRGPTMVQVDTYYVDSTEVTTAQYQQFLTAKGADTTGQPAVCAWNKVYRNTAVALNTPTQPMTNIDWCDALAYCTWAGKHLCGKIGGGPVAPADLLSQTKSQWFLACGGPGGSSHPNASPTCNSSGGTGDLAPVGSFPGCEGHYPGIFDMEGNAAEWVDGCDSTDAGATDTCHLLGGSYIDNQSYCTESFDEPRNSAAAPFGFRCCGG